MLRKKTSTTYFLSSLALIISLTLIVQFYYSSTDSWFSKTSKQPTPIDPYIAIIIEIQATSRLVTAVLNVLEHIPIDWKVQIFILDEHRSFYKKSSLRSLIKAGRVLLTSIDFSRDAVFQQDFFNLYLTSLSFWRQVQGEKVLYFETDSAFCSNSLYRVTDFVHYDFIGVPRQDGRCCNGGLSIRSRSKTILLLESDFGHYPVHQINEDDWFIDNLPKFNGFVASTSIATTFSVQSIYQHRPFAVYRPSLRDLGRENMQLICNECPEARSFTQDCIANISL